MKATLLLAVTLIGLPLNPVTTMAAQVRDARVGDILQRSIPATAEDLQKIFFSAQGTGSGGFGPGNLSYQIHNPFRNRVIEGFVMHVAYVDPATKKDVALDLFV